MSFEPDIKWYSKISADKSIPTRCPFASVYRCPRYYQCLSLMGEAGSTRIDKATDERLVERWKRSDLWPVINEQAPVIMGNVKEQGFLRFCPEVMYDRYGLFVENLHPYSDEIDRDASRKLKRPEHAGWENNWCSLAELHYSDCNMYAMLKESGQRLDDALNAGEILEIKPGAFGISVDVKALVNRFCIWWLRRARKTRNSQQPS